MYKTLETVVQSSEGKIEFTYRKKIIVPSDELFNGNSSNDVGLELQNKDA